jgi:surface protein
VPVALFYTATSFNANIGSWNTARATTMRACEPGISEFSHVKMRRTLLVAALALAGALEAHSKGTAEVAGVVKTSKTRVVCTTTVGDIDIVVRWVLRRRVLLS